MTHRKRDMNRLELRHQIGYEITSIAPFVLLILVSYDSMVLFAKVDEADFP